jgi:hypothetical protein
MTEPAEMWTETALTDGGSTSWQDTETDDTYDATASDASFGLLTYSYSHTDPVDSVYDSCTENQYAPANSSENLVGLISFTETDQAACSGYTAGSNPSAPAARRSRRSPGRTSSGPLLVAWSHGISTAHEILRRVGGRGWCARASPRAWRERWSEPDHRDRQLSAPDRTCVSSREESVRRFETDPASAVVPRDLAADGRFRGPSW